MRQRSRREFLKCGAALPLALQSLGMRGLAKPVAKTPPRRILLICNSLGFYEPNFFPAKPGDLNTSPYLSEIGVQDKMTVFQNLYHPGMETSNHDSEKSFLTGAPSPEATNFNNTVSFDQILAREIGGETRFPFLSFSLYDRGWGCSWNERGVAIPPMHDEREIFDKLFGKEDLTARRQQIENDQHVVRCLYRDIGQLEGVQGSRAKIESYRAVIAELEERLRHEEFWLKARKPEVPDTLLEAGEFAFSVKIKNLLELSKLAFRTDSTRIITLSLDWIYGAISVPGVTGGWHTMSHHGGRADTLKKLGRVETDIVKHLNQFLSELDMIEEDGGTLLDHTTVMVGSNFGDASNHTHNNLPTIVAGGGYRHQAHTVLDRPTPLCSLYLELLHRHGVDVASFGTSQGDLSLLKG